uniref:(northern house mosquito) hypothetical protein n=1 Tax=Culex pipiens TaxID=7175 RepID=A0A8D8NSS2_CULPI
MPGFAAAEGQGDQPGGSAGAAVAAVPERGRTWAPKRRHAGHQHDRAARQGRQRTGTARDALPEHRRLVGGQVRGVLVGGRGRVSAAHHRPGEHRQAGAFPTTKRRGQA